MKYKLILSHIIGFASWKNALTNRFCMKHYEKLLEQTCFSREELTELVGTPDATKMRDVEYINSLGKIYLYAYSNMEHLENSQILRSNMYRISKDGREFFDIKAIYVLVGKMIHIGTYVLVMI